MKTGIHELWSFGNETPKSFGLVKVNTKNYQKIKNVQRSDVIYHEITDTLLFGDNVVMIDDSLADDIALYRENLLPAPKEEGSFNLFYNPMPAPPVRPIGLLNLPMT